MTPPAPPQGAKKMSPENPPAFPRDHAHEGHNGMTLRDWFAGQALSNQIICDSTDWPTNARWAYDQADAMLTARSGPPPERPTD